MSIRVDTSSWIPGALVCGNRGLGVLADDIPEDGDNGGSFLFNDISLPADSGKEICGRVTTWPTSGTLYAYEDGSFEFSDAPDGQYSISYQLYVDGVASGTGTVSLQVGASEATITATTADASFAGSAGCGAAISIDAVADASMFSGAAWSGGAAAINTIVADSLFSGSASVSSVSSAGQINAYAADSVFSGSTISIPNSGTLIAAITSQSIFSGLAFSSPNLFISATTGVSVFRGSAYSGASVISEVMRYVIAAEDRTYKIAAENKTYTVEAHL